VGRGDGAAAVRRQQSRGRGADKPRGKRAYVKGAYALGAPKTYRSRLTINLDASTLDRLDDSGEIRFHQFAR